MAKRQKRFEVMDERAVNKDGFVTEWPEVGLIAMGSPNDPIPSVKVQNGVIVEMDGKKRAEFDFNELFIANYAINASLAEEMMAIPCVEIAR
ncbi:MAG: propanediol dehydratase, partial [Anaerolineae bacterium]|nr:propanediol dehydratase [Anaerolineae bacterium]